MNCKYVFKIIIVGNNTVGKSSLLNKFIDNNFNDTYSTTIGVEFGVKYVTLNDSNNIKLQIWDTAGQESFRSITRSFYRASAGVILMYSIDNKNSFDNIKSWLNDINNELNRNIPIILVGNKKDLNHRREITTEEGLNFAKENNLLFKEISVKYELDSTSVFNILSENIYQKIQNKELKIISSNGIKLEHNVIDEDISKYKCCIIN
tara:strand:+ start:467 stop:1084 length:618 start_codon:yes stop_codon:yes gene_type:complete